MMGLLRGLVSVRWLESRRRRLAERGRARFEWAQAREWAARGYAAPSPPQVKREVLARRGIPGATWIETGTYLGDTAAFLTRYASRVVTIEPDPALHERATRRFAATPGVEVVKGLSEEALPEVLSTVEGNVCLWLDGHFSGGVTFQGPTDTPILRELAIVEEALPRLGAVVVLVDDLRLFQGTPGDAYPSRDTVVDWARRNGMAWEIEHDILVAWRAAPGRGR